MVGILLAIGLFLLIITTIFLHIVRKKYVKYLITHSTALKDLSELNKRFHFYQGKSFDECYTYDNLDFYESISCEDYLIYQLQSKKYDIKNEIKYINYNKENNRSYRQELSKIQNFGNGYSKNMKYLMRIEKKIFNKHVLTPKTHFQISVDIYYSKMNGEICKKKSSTFSSDEILNLIKRIDDRSGRFYNDREIWNSICRVERGFVSNKMRYTIYERDHYRCCICGKSDLLEHLEIDHIKPISKGGKSTYDNLQTLCSRCNREKGNR